MKPKLVFIRANCYRYTFDDSKLLKYVRSKINGAKSILNLYAGKNIIANHEIRVDSDKTMPNLTYNMEDKEFLKLAQNEELQFNVIIYDPPWNDRKAKEFYEGRKIGRYTRYKDDIVSLLKSNGKIISAGYEIDNFGKKRGMELEELAIINPSGEIRPFFISTERRNNYDLGEYF